MFAIIKTGGKQYRVQEGDILDVEKLPAEPTQRFYFSQVLLIADEKETLIGTPFVEKALVQAEILENFKDKKVIVFKKKRRKQYRRTRGHRQQLTRVKIDRIIPDVSVLAPEEIATIEKKRAEEVAPAAIEEKAAPPVPAAKEKPKVAEKKPAKLAKRPTEAAAARAKKEKPAVKEKKPAPAKTTKEKKKE